LQAQFIIVGIFKNNLLNERKKCRRDEKEIAKEQKKKTTLL
jgi:hypothetical protein